MTKSAKSTAQEGMMGTHSHCAGGCEKSVAELRCAKCGAPWVECEPEECVVPSLSYEERAEEAARAWRRERRYLDLGDYQAFVSGFIAAAKLIAARPSPPAPLVTEGQTGYGWEFSPDAIAVLIAAAKWHGMQSSMNTTRLYERCSDLKRSTFSPFEYDSVE